MLRYSFGNVEIVWDAVELGGMMMPSQTDLNRYEDYKAGRPLYVNKKYGLLPVFVGLLTGYFLEFIDIDFSNFLSIRKNTSQVTNP